MNIMGELWKIYIVEMGFRLSQELESTVSVIKKWKGCVTLVDSLGQN